jgi:exonuclease III
MAQPDEGEKHIIQGASNKRINTPIRCIQINPQHSRIATDNLMKLVEKEKPDIIFIQELYLSKSKMTGITRTYRSYFLPEDSYRAAIVITNKEINAVLITLLSSPDIVLLEIEYKNTKAFIVSAYFDITTRIEDELNRLDKILELTKKHGIVIAVDSNSM